MAEGLKRHLPAVWLALIFAALCAGPFIYFTHSRGYSGISMFGPDAEEHYVARMREGTDGHPGLGNTFLGDKDKPYFIPPLGEIVEARLGRLLGFDAAATNIFAKVILPFVAFILAYFLAVALFRSRLAGLLGASIALVGENLTSAPSAWINLLHAVSTSTSFLTYSRAINPELSGPILFGALLLFYKKFFLTSTPRVWDAFALGLLIGLALYISPFVFSFLVVFAVLSCLFFVYRRQYSHMKAIVLSGLVTCFLGLPFIKNFLALHSSPIYSQASLLQGLKFSHLPTSIGLWLVIMIFFILLARRFKIASAATVFFAVSALSLILLLNQQIVTGLSIQSGHYHWYITKPLVGLMLGFIAWWVIQHVTSRRILRQTVSAFILIAIFFNAFLIDLHSYAYQLPGAKDAERYTPVINFLNTLPEQGVWANEELSKYIPIYTSHEVPNNVQIANYLVPRSFFEDRLYTKYRLRGVSEKTVLDTMESEREAVSSAVYGLYWREQTGSFAGIPESELQRLAAGYQAMATTTLAELFSRMGARIVVYDMSHDSLWQHELFSSDEVLFTSGSLQVLRINQ